jgi:hypothetical protein
MLIQTSNQVLKDIYGPAMVRSVSKPERTMLDGTGESTTVSSRAASKEDVP